ncbi:hypothetical protein L6164_007282 [Bauhinia variegata]|uniref:Uncharacterized protein n=1 Tax=Bauhinia variegata TaxID=167791 RepID=A0ACB9PEI5_BAUVA|nr:hypothetical protein L6164_007282 [Bauhinia variegata]
MKIPLKAATTLQPLLVPSSGLGVGGLPKTVTRHLCTSWRPAKTLGFLSCSTMASPPLSHQVRDNIQLSQLEKKIFGRLLGTLRHFGLQTQLRVAGGWVRDKVDEFNRGCWCS